MADPQHYRYDVFISHSQADQEWVEEWLLPRLEAAGLTVCVDETCFEPGAPILDEQARVVEQSRKTVLVLSPAYLESQWSQFESLLVQTLDPGAVKRRLIPVLRKPCQISLRLRPLVSVNLSEADEQQWQRLLKALNSSEPTSLNPVQRLSLTIADISPDNETPGWHPRGSLWLVVGLVCLVLLAGLMNLLLYDLPALRSTVNVMAASLVCLVGFLSLREDRDFFQRLSHFLGRTRAGQVVMGAVLAISLVSWVAVGWPKAQAVAAGPLGPAPRGVKRFAIAEWKNLTPGASRYDGVWTDGTRRALYQKLSLVPSLQSVSLSDPQLVAYAPKGLDYWIEGEYQKIGEVQLSASASQQGRLLPPITAVHGSVDDQDPEAETKILDMQHRLALEILAALGITLDVQTVNAISEVPTISGAALKLNLQADALMSQCQQINDCDYNGMEMLLQQALDLDPKFAEAHNNLGVLLRLQGNLEGAIAEYRKAIELIPGFAVFHRNLGNVYSRTGDYSAAKDALKYAIQLDPAYLKAFNDLSVVYIELGEPDKAGELLHHGLRLASQEPYLHKNLGRVYLAQGRAQAAIDELSQAIQLAKVANPPYNYAEAMYYLAVANQQAGQPSQACQVLTDYRSYADEDSVEDPKRPVAAAELAAELRCP